MNGPVLRIDYLEIKSVLINNLLKYGFEKNKAEILSGIFADNNLYGKDSHGLNRFPSFIQSLKNNVINIDAKPEKINGNKAYEQWDGHLGAGPLNAVFSTDRVMKLADVYGIGCVAIRNSNHWMRGGTYGWRAAEQGYFFICWSNTKPNMPAWGSDEPRLGNNPFVMAIPKKNGPVVLDMAMSQYSYGSMELHSKMNEELPYAGGYDKKGELTTNPDSIIETQRALPAGLWKGSGLALVLDLMAAILSDGKSTKTIGEQEEEFGLSQVFIAIKPGLSGTAQAMNQAVDDILKDYQSTKNIEGIDIFYPGERSVNAYKDRKINGIPVKKSVWDGIKEMI
jgi:3-dehydro-L-gulonate 2-dehydrogenase